MKKIVSVALLSIFLLIGCSNKSDNELNAKKGEGYLSTLNNGTTITEVSESCYKSIENANPLSPTIFCADPTAVEYEGRLYVYATNDHQQYDEVGDDGKNTYDKIKSLVIFSTDDMVNWTYHGIIDTKAVAPWIINSWAPSVTSRVEADGLTHFYLYFSNNGCGVGVITATNPLGPWSDPLGEPLVSTSTEGLSDCPNPFDPGVCIDDNGVGWLSFGGGTASNGTKYMPGVSRIVRLSEDMTSFDSEFVSIDAPYFFEASELNFINGTYVYTYNNSWEPRAKWEIDGYSTPSACSMAYMTTKTPLDGASWEYRGDYFPNPGECGMDYSNNHSHLHKYMDRYYMFHHTMLRQASMTTNGGFRSVSVIEIPVDEATLEITETKTTKTGVSQLRYLNPFSENAAETLFTCAGISYNTEGTLVSSVKSDEKGAWICVKGANFSETAKYFSSKVSGKGRIELRIDDVNAPCIASLDFNNSDFGGVYGELSEKLDGAHDIYIVFSDTGISLDSWSFM